MNEEKAKKLFEYLSNEEYNLNNRVFKDLDLWEVFKSVNFTNSKIGEQFLFYSLHKLNNNNNQSESFEEKIQFIKNLNKQKKDDFKKELGVLNKDFNYDLVDIIFSKWLNLPYVWYDYSPFLFILLIISIIGIFLFPRIFIYPIIILPSVYLILHLINKAFVFYSFRFFQNLNSFISVLGNISIPIYTFKSYKSFKKKSFLIKILLVNEVLEKKSIAFGLLNFLIDIFKGFFLIDILIINFLQKKLTFNKNLKSDFLSIGELDTILSILELRKKKNTCISKFSKNTLAMDSLIHPIVENCIPNTINTKKSVLVTGANMSGKTTFIKAVGVNLILARSLNTCFAKKFEFDFFEIFTSIDIRQELSENKSYFKAEVDVMKMLIENSKTKKSLFIIDEIFKGTNTKERIALSFSILKFLTLNESLVFVSTHDVELVNLLKNYFDQYHFDFFIKNNDIAFDYKLKNGAIMCNYAIELIKQNDFPSIIIEEAEKYLIENEK